MKQYQLVASITRLRGVKGEVEVRSIDDLLSHLRSDVRLFIVPPTLTGVRYTQIVSSRGTRTEPWLVLQGVNNRTDAASLVGRYLLADVEDLDEQTSSTEQSSPVAQLSEVSNSKTFQLPDQMIPDNTQGMTVYDDKYGFIGTIIEESKVTPQVLWTLEGPFGRVLVPAVDAFVKSWTDESVFVQIPEGLLGLNQ